MGNKNLRFWQLMPL